MAYAKLCTASVRASRTSSASRCTLVEKSVSPTMASVRLPISAVMSIVAPSVMVSRQRRACLTIASAKRCTCWRWNSGWIVRRCRRCICPSDVRRPSPSSFLARCSAMPFMNFFAEVTRMSSMKSRMAHQVDGLRAEREPRHVTVGPRRLRKEGQRIPAEGEEVPAGEPGRRPRHLFDVRRQGEGHRVRYRHFTRRPRPPPP